MDTNMFLPFLKATFIIAAINATTFSGVWTDDFSSAWSITNALMGDLVNPTITTSKREYHGAFTILYPAGASGSTNAGAITTMQRTFQCSYDSTVYISFKFAYCRTETND
eukprot:289932_1